jgi:NAD(P)-dependent dehydrogenase (short-subunit alcohol dehydrogenase family)
MVFPSWQLSRDDYGRLCAYLALTPQEAIYTRLLDYLAEAPFRAPPVRGFAAYLAALRLTRFRIARLDLVTKRLLPSHPFRHAINAVVALHECDGQGFAELSRAPSALWLLPSLAGWGLGLVLSVLLTLPWLAWHGLGYLLSGPGTWQLGLRGKRVLVTGVGRGLGQDLFALALEQGAEVIGTVRDTAAAERLRERLPATAPARLVAADLAVPGALPDALEQAAIVPQEIDIAILSAGTKAEGASLLSVQDMEATFRVNLFAPVELAAWLCPRAQDLVLVLISSIGRWHGMPFSGGYNASKAALSIWADGLAMEQPGGRGSRCHVLTVEPGLFESAMVRLTGLTRLLAVPRREVARRVFAAAHRRRAVLRWPAGFTALTWGLCLAGRGVRGRVFAKVKEPASQ